MADVHGDVVAEVEVDEIFRQADKNKNDELDPLEVAKVAELWTKVAQDKLMAKYDSSGSGKLDEFKEVKVLLIDLNEGTEVTDKQVHDFMAMLGKVEDLTMA